MAGSCQYCGCKIIRDNGGVALAKRKYCSQKCYGLASRKSVADRIKETVKIDPNTGCWNWPRKYAQISCDGQYFLVHRVSYELVHGPIPTGKEIHHRCENPACCNPAHLECLTHGLHAQVSRRALATHCKYGHEYTPENTRWEGSTGRERVCRMCKKIRERERRVRLSQAVSVTNSAA